MLIAIKCDIRKFTMSGYRFMLRQVGANHALRFFSTTSWKLDGSASTKSPSQPIYFSRYSVLERVSPSRAPHSIKNPFFYNFFDKSHIL